MPGPPRSMRDALVRGGLQCCRYFDGAGGDARGAMPLTKAGPVIIRGIVAGERETLRKVLHASGKPRLGLNARHTLVRRAGVDRTLIDRRGWARLPSRIRVLYRVPARVAQPASSTSLLVAWSALGHRQLQRQGFSREHEARGAPGAQIAYDNHVIRWLRARCFL